MNPGIHRITAEEYHARRDMLSASIAKVLLERSPAHAYYLASHPDESKTKQQDRGTVAHALLFEGIDRMAVLDFPDWRTSAAKAARDTARADRKIPVLAKDERPIFEMVAAARLAWEECPDLKGYGPDDGEGELSLVWDQDGVMCRCRPDWYASDRRVMVDAKFTEASAAPEQAARQVISQAHDQRAAFYAQGGLMVAAVEPRYVYLYQEVDPPYCTSFIGIPPAMLELGLSKFHYALGKWRECRETGIWPGYESRIHYAEPPAWALESWGLRDDAPQTGIPYDPGKLWEKRA